MNSPSEELLPTTRRSLLHRLATAQREGRAPSLAAAVRRGGRIVWSGGRTSLEGQVADADTQYRIGSISKTFTAVLVLRLRDEGLIDLGDQLERHLPGTGAGGATIFQLLGHSAGLGAEAPAPWWERTPGALRPKLADVLGEQPQMHPAGHRFHYSNPGYTLLGSLVEAVRGVSWVEALRREILEPLGMDRTTYGPVAPYAEGWAVHPWADVVVSEPAEDLGLMAPAGQLWSTAADLLRFAAFLVEGDDRVLSATSVREMRTPASPVAEPGGNGYGLGLQIVKTDSRVLVGHAGSLPGFVAGLWFSEDDDVAAVALANATSGLPAATVAAELLTIVADAEPRIPEPWRPLPEADAELVALTGIWHWGTHTFTLKLTEGRGLELRPLGSKGRGAFFTARPDGTWTGLDDYYAGETLRVVRREDGSVDHLDLGSFAFTREPYDADADIPGGLDPAGWRGLGG